MKNHLFLPFFFFVGLVLSGCEPASQPSNGSGTHVTDTAAKPGPGDNLGARPWAADKNMLDPNGFDALPSPMDLYTMPFSPAFLQAQGIQSIELNIYSSADNDDLQSSSSENGLSISQKRRYTFGNNGQPLTLRDEKFLGDATPATRFVATWVYNAAGLKTRLDMVDSLGTRKIPHALTFKYVDDLQLSASEDPTALSTYFQDDAAQGHSYLLRKSAQDGSSEVYVIGKEGAFPDSVCLRIQAEILDRQSKFVDYVKAGPKLANVTFREQDARRTLREVHMGRKGRIDFMVSRSYNADGNLVERNYRWDDEGAPIRTLSRYSYTSKGDLEQVIVQKQPFNGDVSNQIDRYTYDAKGMLQKQTRSTRTNGGPEMIEWIGFFKVTQGAAQPVGDTQPGGTH